jgi:hypothetical protein
MKVTPTNRINGLMGEVVRYAENDNYFLVLTVPHSKSRKESVYVISILEYEAREMCKKWNVTLQVRPVPAKPPGK